MVASSTWDTPMLMHCVVKFKSMEDYDAFGILLVYIAEQFLVKLVKALLIPLAITYGSSVLGRISVNLFALFQQFYNNCLRFVCNVARF